MTRRMVAQGVAAGAALALLGGCGGGTGKDELVVFAAASLGDAMADIGDAYVELRPDVTVSLNAAGSSSLREQILDGAPADVFASANRTTMAAVVDAGEVVDGPQVFATNELALAVPADNPGGVTGLDDLARDDLFIGVCAPAVPCGEFARELIAAAGVEARVDTEEPDVRALLTKLEAGELDAGIVYTTDVLAADGSVRAVELGGEEIDVRVDYPIAALRGAGRLGGDFVEFVRSADARAILREHGFGVP